MDSRERVILPKGVQHGTYAQTLQQDGYINMLGRPPFNYTVGAPMRKSGFLSTENLLGSSGDKTIFKPCKTVEQCFMDRQLSHVHMTAGVSDAVDSYKLILTSSRTNASI
jgi:hypothetical protein